MMLKGAEVPPSRPDVHSLTTVSCARIARASAGSTRAPGRRLRHTRFHVAAAVMLRCSVGGHEPGSSSSLVGQARPPAASHGMRACRIVEHIVASDRETARIARLAIATRHDTSPTSGAAEYLPPSADDAICRAGQPRSATLSIKPSMCSIAMRSAATAAPMCSGVVAHSPIASAAPAGGATAW